METIENLILLAIVLLIGYSFFAGIHESYRNYNRVHFYVARDKDGSLYVYFGKPERSDFTFMPCAVGCCIADISESQEFGLKSDDFKDLKWEDEPVEVFLNMED